jgi:phytoene synthase
MSETALEAAMLASLETVRRLDHDRFLTALLAPAEQRPKLIALYAFNAEIARIRETVSESMLGQIRLQWWRETIEAIGEGNPGGHEIAIALWNVFPGVDYDKAGLLNLIDARERDLDETPFDNMKALEDYGIATSSGLMRLAAKSLSPSSASVTIESINAAGIAYALTGLLRALPTHAAQGRLFLPLDMLRTHDVDPHQILAGEMSNGLSAIIRDVAKIARQHLVRARVSMPRAGRAVLPALWPASLCDAYLKRLMAEPFNPFRDVVEVPAFRQQMRLLGRKVCRKF